MNYNLLILQAVGLNVIFQLFMKLAQTYSQLLAVVQRKILLLMICALTIGAVSVSAQKKQEIKYIQNSEAAGKYLPVGKTFGCRRTLGPMFVPREGTVLATLADGETPALVLKKFADHTVCYSSIPGGFSSELVKGLAELAGITVINQEQSDCTYVSDNMFAVHTKNGGQRTFNVPPRFTKKATELFTRKEFAIQDGKFQAELEPVSTSIFLME